MKPNWKRPKTLDSVTISIPTARGDTPMGTLHLTFGYYKNSLVEVIGKIGKSGSLAATNLDILCRLLSCYLQTNTSRKKLIKKLKKNLWDIKGELPFTYENEKFEGYEDFIFKRICEEIESRELQKELG